jgi:hypothetical protein
MKFLNFIFITILVLSTNMGYAAKITDDGLRIGKKGSTSNVILKIADSALALIFNRVDGKIQFTNNGTVINDLGGGGSSDGLVKRDSESPAFVKTAAGTISVKAGTSIMVNGANVAFSSQTPVIMPTLTQGTDYAIYACDDGTIRASDNWSAPSGYTPTNSKKIGGFHYGMISPTETVAGGSFATTGSGMIWNQADVDKIKGINQFSIWDLKFRPSCPDPRGFALAKSTWVAIYLTGTGHEVNGLSRYNTDVASGTVPPKIPIEYGGNGTSTYSTLNWWQANEIVKAQGARLIRESEFVTAAFGVTENQSLGGASTTIPVTKREPGYTSKYGIEQASGNHWTWGEDSGFIYTSTAVGAYRENGGRGQYYTQGTVGTVRVLLGGARNVAANSGSRASDWVNPPTDSSWSIGVRAACDHLKLP